MKANPGEVLALYYKGRYQLAGSMADIAAFIHAHTPHSLNHALKHEGWSIRPVKKNPGEGYHFSKQQLALASAANFRKHGADRPATYHEGKAQAEKEAVAEMKRRGGGGLWRANAAGLPLNWKKSRKRRHTAHNPIGPVESITVEHGSQPQQALLASGWKVAKVEGAKAMMVKANLGRDEHRLRAALAGVDMRFASEVLRDPMKAEFYRGKRTAHVVSMKPTGNPGPGKRHMVEVVKASKVYGKHATGWVTLVDGHIALHGDKTDCMRIAERAGGANVVDGKRVSGNPGFRASYRSLAYDRDLGAYAFEAPSLEEARDKAIEEGVRRGAWGCWLRAQDEPKGEHIVVSAAKRNPAPGENLLEQRTAFRRAVEMARKKGWDRVFVVFNQSLGQYEILEHPPTMGRCWEVDLHEGTSGQATPHNNPGASEWQPHYGKVVWRKGDWAIVEQKGFCYGTPFTVYYKGEQAGMNYGSFAQAKHYAQQMSRGASSNPGAPWHSRMARTAGHQRALAKRGGKARTADVLLGAELAHKASAKESLAVEEVVGRIKGNSHALSRHWELPSGKRAITERIAFLQRILAQSRMHDKGSVKAWRAEVKELKARLASEYSMTDFPPPGPQAAPNPSPRFKVVTDYKPRGSDYIVGATWHCTTKAEALGFARKLMDRSRAYNSTKVAVLTHPGNKPVARYYKEGRLWKECKL